MQFARVALLCVYDMKLICCILVSGNSHDSRHVKLYHRRSVWLRDRNFESEMISSMPNSGRR